MKGKGIFGMTQEEFTRWLNKGNDIEEPSGCRGCGAIAGCCKDYPNCPGNPDWKSPLPDIGNNNETNK